MSPDAGLAADQHQAAATGNRCVEMLAESGELDLAFDQLHGRMLRRYLALLVAASDNCASPVRRPRRVRVPLAA